MKKRYWRYDNGDTPVITDDLKVINDLLTSEADSYKDEDVYKKDGEPNWTIDLIWLTDEELENLPDL